MAAPGKTPAPPGTAQSTKTPIPAKGGAKDPKAAQLPPGVKQPPVAEAPSPAKPESEPSPTKALKIPEKLRDIKSLNLATDTLVLVLTEQLTAAKAKLQVAESEIIA